MQYGKQNKRSLLKNLRILLRGTYFAHRLEPKMLPVSILMALVTASRPFINIIMTSRILNTLLVLLAQQEKDFSAIAQQVILTISLNCFATVFEAWAFNYRNVLILSVNRKQWMALSKKMMRMDYQTAEDARTHFLYQQILDRCMYTNCNLWGVIEKIEALLMGSVQIGISVGITASLFWNQGKAENTSELAEVINSPVLAFGLIALITLSVAVSAVLSIRQNRRLAALSSDEDFNRRNRVFDFYAGYLDDYKTGKDVRLYRQNEMIRKEFQKARNGMKKMYAQMNRCSGGYEAAKSAISVSISGTVYLYVGCKALAGVISVGNIVRYTGGVSQFIAGLSMLLTQVSDLKMMTENFELFFDYLDKEEVMKSGEKTMEEDAGSSHRIEFKDVSFRYPGNENWVLRHVNLQFTSGQKVAIVGMNGSGKTTLIKLLCRLYDPVEGQILLDGVDIREYDYDTYQKLFAVVFQDFALFALGIAQNVAAGEMYDPVRVENALRQSGLWDRVAKMEKGMETPIYKEYHKDGVEISGGEAQKLAIARALYRKAPFVILDEPTAALDPISEHEIYTRFDSMVGDRTAIYISHRLSSCRFCDEILVFDCGVLVQRGSHEKLVKDCGGKYFELWNAQAQYYEK